ncbi:MAG: hypothetical protein GX640_04940 [Fibrobacter sp.]|nr:hypothetical protein [Fibrobacter sp.]
MFNRKQILFTLAIVALGISSSFARNILEKKMFYLTNNNKQGQAIYWVIYLGNFDLKLNRKFPGEPEQQIDASVNFNYLSSGYIEGNGYSAKGKIDCLPTMEIKNESGERQIKSDSIDFIYDYGSKVQLINGEKGEFIINVEGDRQTAKKFLMREYKQQVLYGEKILKEGSEETYVAAIAFTKEGLARAVKEQAKIDANQ